MTVPLALLAFAATVVLLAPRLLLRAAWVRTSPRWGIIVWQAAVLSVLTALGLLALAAVLPVERVWFDLGHLLHACPELLRRRYAWWHPAGIRIVSIVVAALVLAALARATVVSALTVRRTRQRQRDLLALLAHAHDDRHGAHVLEHDVPLAYCVPGDGGRVVVTSAAVEALSDHQLAAVMAHERAHLQGRHDLVLFGADVASTALPWPRFFRTARQQLRMLVEMLADDHAVQVSGIDSLTTALVDLGGATTPHGALGAAGDTLARVQRLTAPRGRVLSRLRRVGVLTAAALLVTLPWLIVVVPAIAASRAASCPV